MTNWLKKNASTIFTCFGAAGVVATVVLAIRATPHAEFNISSAQLGKGKEMLRDHRDAELTRSENGKYILPELTVMETIQCCWKEYIPTVAVGLGSLACIFGANVLDRKRQASMASAYTALASAFEGYRNKVESLCGPGTDDAINKAVIQEKKDIEDNRPPWDTIQTFYIEGQPTFFERTMEQVMWAEYHLNRNFILKQSVTLNELFDFLDLPHTEVGCTGWDQYDGEATYGYKWIDFDHRYYTTDDGMLVCAIDMPFAPHPFSDDE